MKMLKHLSHLRKMVRSMAGINDCYDCKNRHINCHSTCESYKKWKQEWDERKKSELFRKRIKNSGYYYK